MLVDGFPLSFVIALEDWLSIGVDLVLVNLLNHFNFDANSTESLPTYCTTLHTVYITLGMCTVNSCKSPEMGSSRLTGKGMCSFWRCSLFCIRVGVRLV
jgi:hypothetical protein